jgi:hypothetical protein
MLPKPVKRPNHRPLKPIDWEEVDSYIQGGCSGPEIAAYIGIDSDTFYSRYEREYGSAFSARRSLRWGAGKAKIKMRQFKSAMEGNTVMLKLLGEEWLGQGRKEDSTSLDLVDLKNQVLEGEISQI